MEIILGYDLKVTGHALPDAYKWAKLQFGGYVTHGRKRWVGDILSYTFFFQERSDATWFWLVWV